jgi:hypothetical protein
MPKYQYMIGIILLSSFIIIMHLLGEYRIFELSISIESLINYLSSIATILGIVGAVILGYFFFVFQTIETKQQNCYIALRTELNNLVDILFILPEDFKYLTIPLHECIVSLQTRKLRDYPIVGDDWKPIHNIVDILEKKKDFGHPVIYKMINSLNIIEDYAGEIGVSKVAVVCSLFILKSIKKFFYLLLFSIGGIFLFYLLVDKYNVHPLAISSLMFILLYFVGTAILETLLHLHDYYREVVPEDNKDEINNYI